MENELVSGARAAGDSSVFFDLGHRIDLELNARVRAIVEALRRARLAGIVEVVPAYGSFMVRYDPTLTDFDTVVGAVAGLGPRPVPQSGRTFLLPVAYGHEFGPDLNDVAALNGLDSDEVVERHSAPFYPIYCLGFTPGFPFLGGLDPALHTPRLDTPRTCVPAGSVAIGGEQTGVYPVSMPGGWRIIGRCPLRLFDPLSNPPVRYAPGDLIRFCSIGADKFHQLEGLTDWRND